MKLSLKQLANILGYREEVILSMLAETESNELQLKLYIDIEQSDTLDEEDVYEFYLREPVMTDCFISVSSPNEEEWEWEPLRKWLY